MVKRNVVSIFYAMAISVNMASHTTELFLVYCESHHFGIYMYFYGDIFFFFFLHLQTYLAENYQSRT